MRDVAGAVHDGAERRRQAAAEEVVPELPRGALLMYDYRVMHRGGRNASADAGACGVSRPVAYIMRSRRGLEGDTWNFPSESVWDAQSLAAEPLAGDGDSMVASPPP